MAGVLRFGSNAFGVFKGLLGAKTGEKVCKRGWIKRFIKNRWFGNLSGGQKAFLLGGAGLSLLPFLTGGAEEEDEGVVEGFDVTPGTIQHRSSSKKRDPIKIFTTDTVCSTRFFAAAEGGIADLPKLEC